MTREGRITHQDLRERVNDAVDRTLNQYLSAHTEVTLDDMHALDAAVSQVLDAAMEQLEREQEAVMEENDTQGTTEETKAPPAAGDQADGAGSNEPAAETEAAGDTATE